MGWSRLTRDRDDPLLEGVADGAYAYFVHGFVCPDGPATLARADYGGPVPPWCALKTAGAASSTPNARPRPGRPSSRTFWA